MYKNMKQLCLKSDFKDIFLKLATNGQSDKAFLLTSEFCPQRVVCPCPGAIYMWKNIKKMCIKSEFKEICLKLATNAVIFLQICNSESLTSNRFYESWAKFMSPTCWLSHEPWGHWESHSNNVQNMFDSEIKLFDLISLLYNLFINLD